MAYITVVMTVSGEDKGLGRRLESVLSQLDENDEVLILPCFPCPPDETLHDAARHARVKITGSAGRNPLENLEAALSQAAGEYILFTGPHDTWHPDKRAACVCELSKPRVAAVVHDAVVVDGDFNEVESSLLRHRFRTGLLPNLIKNRYTGCCLALRKEALCIALPFPPCVSMPGRWLGVAAGKIGRVKFLDRTLAFCCRRRADDMGVRKTMGVSLSTIREAVSLCFKLSRRARLINKEEKGRDKVYQDNNSE